MIIKNLVGLSWAACLGDKSRDRPAKRLRISPPLSCLQQEEKRTRNQTRPSQRPVQPPKFCVSSTPRCKHVSCYIRAALHLSSDSHTPTNYPLRDIQTHLHTHPEPTPLRQTAPPRLTAKEKTAVAIRPQQPPTNGSSHISQGSLRDVFFSMKFSLNRKKVEATASSLALPLPRI